MVNISKPHSVETKLQRSAFGPLTKCNTYSSKNCTWL